MTTDQPTIIFANEEQKRLWLGALRGEIPNPKTGKPFEQGRDVLETTKGNCCCLGVLQIVLSGDVSRWPQGSSMSLPDEIWLRKHSVEFLSDTYRLCEAPFLTTLDKYASRANDAGSTFLEIADAIEACSVVRSSE
jgi:hypothetical protein